MSENARIRQRLIVRGIVQGVGFRPFVYGLATRHGLGGFVGNDSNGVFIEVEGEPAALEAFARDLQAEPPPLALIESVTSMPLPATGETTFVIVASEGQAGASTAISPDVCICDDCLRELFDPADRRYRYPFINCTNCGPRFTIIRDIPYDRPLTTMAAFPMCAACAREYHDPTDRRFHAQPVACPACGPRVWFEAGGRATAWDDDAIRAAQAALRSGRIVAVKGIGGFHLACDATNDDALRTLRRRKGRVDKPFAVMVRDLAAARALAEVDDAEAALLTSKARPIVLLRRRPDARLSALVAPGNAYVGLMLPYSPLHYLLLDGLDMPLVMTSGNLSDEPICKDNDEALRRLASLADGFLLHNRDIHVWCDDSVMRAFEGRELPIRRSRGYTPFPVRLAQPAPMLIATGGELKATFCVTRERFAYLSQHIGDMENLETLQAFERALTHFVKLFRIVPERIVCDLHPGYLSTQWAERFAAAQGLPLVKVQHHHAHIAACLAEHGFDPDARAIGISFDGTGYGSDGAIWGGEVLIANCRTFTRIAHLKYVPLPGGDASIKRPYRAALAHLWAAGIAWDEDLPCVAACPPEERRVLCQQLERNFHCPPTSSMGRLFDAIAALAGVRQTATYEAQAAIELEALCDDAEQGHYEWVSAPSAGGDALVLDPAPIFHGIMRDLHASVSRQAIAAKAHNTIAELIVQVSDHARRQSGLNVVALSGGVFQNVQLLQRALPRLRAAGFEVLTHRAVPPNDGGLALGQAAVGGFRA
ncbi:MAG: carbamoyltransferase HypF [Anaerolineae bacterium]|nr:carbamoyltransferase HypF [Candidatus Roseilinea sp.]MDW8450121.1 carbamoyltransferase HypF [Anaerolineae bacterium]